MTRYEPGDVVLVRFPFTDLSSSKRRPALILNPPKFTARHGDVVVLALTSQPQKNAGRRINRWQSAGLPKPTWVKPIVGTLAAALIETASTTATTSSRSPTCSSSRWPTSVASAFPRIATDPPSATTPAPS